MALNARQKVQAARTALVLDQPFFGVLALRLRVVEDPGCGTAWTDGVSMGYDPEYVVSLTTAEVLGLIAHEVMHCACGHPWRRDGRAMVRWNIAADYAINSVLAEAKFTLPEAGLRKPEYDGKAAEWIYVRLPPDPPQKPQAGAGKGQGEGKGKPQPGAGTPVSAAAPGRGAVPGAGGQDVRDAPTGDAAGADAPTALEADWQQAVQQAATAAKSRGKLPASLDRFAKKAAAPKVDWRSVLHRFVQQAAKSDYSWRQPNPRYLAGGLYLPALRSEALGPMAVAIDTSGSIDEVTLGQFEAELRSVVDDVRPERVHVIYCDTKVHRVDTFERDDVIALKPVGGGGTAFAPALAAADALDEPPVCLVYLTDLMGSFPPQPPSMPVLWATTHLSAVPFGEVVSLEEA